MDASYNNKKSLILSVFLCPHFFEIERHCHRGIPARETRVPRHLRTLGDDDPTLFGRYGTLNIKLNMLILSANVSDCKSKVNLITGTSEYRISDIA